MDQQSFTDANKDLIDPNTLLFEKHTENLSTNQMNSLWALVDGVHSEFSSQEVLQIIQYFH